MKRECLILCLGVLFSCGSRADAIPAPAKQLVSQESLIGDTQRKLLPSSPPVLSPQPEQNARADIFVRESPCWVIDNVETATAPVRLTAFNRLAHTARGRCIGEQGLARLHKKLQNELIAQGYITSRVQLGVQEAPTGILKVSVHYGRIGQLRMQAGSSAYFRPDALFPIAAGDVLNLRSLEQGLENMGGIPRVISDIRIVPGERLDESDIEILRQQDKYWRFTAWTDDAGVGSTGRYQAGGALYLDNLAALSDVFYLSMARSVLAPPGKGNESRALYYSLPWGFWRFSALGGDSRYHQTVAGNFTDYRYNGRSQYWGLQADYIVARGMNEKTALNAQLLQRYYRYYLNDTEIALQSTRLTSLKLGGSHLYYGARSQIALTADAIAGVGEGSTSAEHRLRVGGSMLKPISVSGLRLRYLGELSGQWANAAQPIQDKSFIGDRSTVRGFSGDSKLIGSSGGYLRNTLMWEQGVLQPYIGFDYGQLAKQQGEGGKLAGSVIGVQVNQERFAADIFAGVPVIKPGSFPNERLVLGFSSQFSF
ncbi:ShlB/FhaC/HecB family hemolysin secretion/activation protein [Serratia marcescens]|uniref:ShlB/FhaC/HecB family hemolysin secretion/activation protein n=1 Tax=Serratia marcescens TaxID=615 RepID=UPI0039839451